VSEKRWTDDARLGPVSTKKWSRRVHRFLRF
jgi:hypothetical protein